ncbi:MAG: hypothetical protein KC416_11665 [Myxococcales bacterium]|nr:hypothetical protein [Myxococcales bacterium]
MKDNTLGSGQYEYVTAIAAVSVVGALGLGLLGGAFEDALRGDVQGEVASNAALPGGDPSLEDSAPALGEQAALFGSSWRAFNRAVFTTADAVDSVDGKILRRRAAVNGFTNRIENGESLAREAVAGGRGRGLSRAVATVPAGAHVAAGAVGIAGSTVIQKTGRVVGGATRGVSAVGHNAKTAFRKWIKRPGAEYRNVLDAVRTPAWEPRSLKALKVSEGGFINRMSTWFDNRSIRAENRRIKVSNAFGEWYNRSVGERLGRLRTNAGETFAASTAGIHEHVVGPAIVGVSRVTKYPRAVVDDFLLGQGRIPGGGEEALRFATPQTVAGKTRTVVDFGDARVRNGLLGTEVDNIFAKFEAEWDAFRAGK